MNGQLKFTFEHVISEANLEKYENELVFELAKSDLLEFQ